VVKVHFSVLSDAPESIMDSQTNHVPG